MPRHHGGGNAPQIGSSTLLNIGRRYNTHFKPFTGGAVQISRVGMPRRPAPVLPLRRRVESCKGVQQATAAVGKDHVMQEKYMYIQRKCSISAHTISSIGRQRASCTRRLHPPTCTEEITLVSGKRKEKGPQPQSKQRTKQEESLELNQHLQPKSEVPVVCKLGDNVRVVLRCEVRSWQEDYQACFASIVLLRLVVVCCRCAGNMLVAARSDAVPLTNPLHVWIGVCSCDRGAGRPPRSSDSADPAAAAHWQQQQVHKQHCAGSNGKLHTYALYAWSSKGACYCCCGWRWV